MKKLVTYKLFEAKKSIDEISYELEDICIDIKDYSNLILSIRNNEDGGEHITIFINSIYTAFYMDETITDVIIRLKNYCTLNNYYSDFQYVDMNIAAFRYYPLFIIDDKVMNKYHQTFTYMKPQGGWLSKELMENLIRCIKIEISNEPI